MISRFPKLSPILETDENVTFYMEYLTEDGYSLAVIAGLSAIATITTILLNALAFVTIVTESEARTPFNMIIAFMAGLNVLAGLLALLCVIAGGVEYLFGSIWLVDMVTDITVYAIGFASFIQIIFVPFFLSSDTP